MICGFSQRLNVLTPDDGFNLISISLKSRSYYVYSTVQISRVFADVF